MIFDVGANQGIYSLAGLASAPTATVHAFEPTPQIAEQLKRTAELNKLARLNVNEVAVSNRTGTASLVQYRGGDGANGGMNFLATVKPNGVEALDRRNRSSTESRPNAVSVGADILVFPKCTKHLCKPFSKINHP